jgi:hypothetical protein
MMISIWILAIPTSKFKTSISKYNFDIEDFDVEDIDISISKAG